MTKGFVDQIEIKTDYTSEYEKVPLQNRRTSGRKGGKTQKGISIDNSVLRPAYPKPLPISKAKKTDLLSLCKSGAISKRFHAFYEQLPTADDIRDCLPEPDFTENVDDSDQ